MNLQELHPKMGELLTRETWALKDAAVFVEDRLMEKVDRFITHCRGLAAFAEEGLPGNCSMLLSGPPGSGKTQSARHISARLGVPLLTVSLDSLISCWVGDTGKHIRMVFEEAKGQKAVLFLDEVDAVGLNRSRPDSRDYGMQATITVMQCLDSVADAGIVIGATNRVEALDPALKRRFYHQAEYGLPGRSEALCIAKFWLTRGKRVKLEMGEDEEDEYWTALEGLSGDGIRGVCCQALRDAIVNGEALKKEVVLETARGRERES